MFVFKTIVAERTPSETDHVSRRRECRRCDFSRRFAFAGLRYPCATLLLVRETPDGLRVRRHCALVGGEVVVVGRGQVPRVASGVSRGAVARARPPPELGTPPWRLAPNPRRTRLAADSRGHNVNMILSCPRIMHTDGCFKLNYPHPTTGVRQPAPPRALVGLYPLAYRRPSRPRRPHRRPL